MSKQIAKQEKNKKQHDESLGNAVMIGAMAPNHNLDSTENFRQGNVNLTATTITESTL